MKIYIIQINDSSISLKTPPYWLHSMFWDKPLNQKIDKICVIFQFKTSFYHSTPLVECIKDKKDKNAVNTTFSTKSEIASLLEKWSYSSGFLQPLTVNKPIKLKEPMYLYGWNIYSYLGDKIITGQILDYSDESVFLITNTNTLLPILRGPKIEKLKSYRWNDLDKFKLSYQKTIKNIDVLKISYLWKPFTLKLNSKNETSALETSHKLIIPIKQKEFVGSNIETSVFSIDIEKIEESIFKGKNKERKDKNIIFSKRFKYLKENYQLFCLHLSNKLQEEFLFRSNIINILDDNELSNPKKQEKIYDLLLKFDKFWGTLQDVKNIHRYELKNNRKICKSYKSKDKCDTNLQCKWSNNKCKFQIPVGNQNKYIGMISCSLVDMPLFRKELLRENGMEWSWIVNPLYVKERKEQLILQSSSKEYIDKKTNYAFTQEEYQQDIERKKIVQVQDFKMIEFLNNSFLNAVAYSLYNIEYNVFSYTNKVSKQIIQTWIHSLKQIILDEINKIFDKKKKIKKNTSRLNWISQSKQLKIISSVLEINIVIYNIKSKKLKIVKEISKKYKKTIYLGNSPSKTMKLNITHALFR